MRRKNKLSEKLTKKASGNSRLQQLGFQALFKVGFVFAKFSLKPKVKASLTPTASSRETLECNWIVTLIPRLLNAMNFRDILLWDFKGKRNFASSLTIKSQKVYFRTFDNVKDLAKLLEINDIVKFLFIITLKSHKKQRPKTPLLTSLSMFDKRNK